ncbi:radical SAM family heme chaperone HemW [Spiroplasma tabanidicola]|uniref:Heme chaperone HemW n=1 Tax=Spiroplasma tabanidicola TaxID=324079 RepID=A0A6I6CC12_9MOLU|nr:radical SAM family heme chaperone HemW [Spiroplasma tabanidicola]QGS51778.1 oxygen-independent coproporphyrinogen III oxidase [Spiroplasma tabanidicola]
MTKKQELKNRNIKSLYVHIPYCEHICFYCDFAKTIKPKSKENVIEYLNNLENELISYENRLDNLETIYIGGGTPSCLDEEETILLLKSLSKYVKNNKDFEFSIELNPESVSETKLKIYKEYKINRISMGIQTFNNDLLKKIGRIHDKDLAVEKFNLIRTIGFDNISIDLMYNLFNQTKENIIEDLEYIKQLKPDHISWYSLIMKDNSIWGKKNLKKPENDEFFDVIVNEGLKKLGYKRYEISNYCLNNKISKHNLSYWDNSLFAGVGFGASGFELINKKYYLTINEGTILNYQKKFEELSIEDYYFQIIMMGLRLVDGINISLEKNKDAYLFYKEKIEINIKKGFLLLENNYLKCNDKGFDILNDILVDIL